MGRETKSAISAFVLPVFGGLISKVLASPPPAVSSPCARWMNVWDGRRSSQHGVTWAVSVGISDPIGRGNGKPSHTLPLSEMHQQLPQFLGADRTHRNFPIDPGWRHNFHNARSGRMRHYERCALRRSPWHFRGLRICTAQLREPEHRVETRSGTGCALLRPVDSPRRRYRSYLQGSRHTITVHRSVVVLCLEP